MAQPSTDDFAPRILTQLANMRYACSSLVLLCGGTANYVYRGQLREPFEDGTVEIVIKHGEAFAAQFSVFKLLKYPRVPTQVRFAV